VKLGFIDNGAVNAITDRGNLNMCPACITAALIAGGTASTGGLTALFVKKFAAIKLRASNIAKKVSRPIQSKENDDGNQHNRNKAAEDCIASRVA
jgi:hypothetical protein